MKKTEFIIILAILVNITALPSLTSAQVEVKGGSATANAGISQVSVSTSTKAIESSQNKNNTASQTKNLYEQGAKLGQQETISPKTSALSIISLIFSFTALILTVYLFLRMRKIMK